MIDIQVQQLLKIVNISASDHEDSLLPFGGMIHDLPVPNIII